MPPELQIFDDGLSNPLDTVEEVLLEHNWMFNRMTNDELMVQVMGKSCEYRVFFIWQEEMNALQFCCQYDMVIPKSNFTDAARSFMSLNEQLWMGHFDLPADTRIPTFRHTCLLRGLQGDAHNDYLEDLLDISMTQCEKHFPVIDMLARGVDINDQSLSLALMHVEGRA